MHIVDADDPAAVALLPAGPLLLSPAPVWYSTYVPSLADLPND